MSNRELVTQALEAQYRSSSTATVFRNGNIMMNPYHFSAGEDAPANQALALSLTEQIYAAPVEEQGAFAAELGKQNDAAGPYMLWEAFVSGHVDIYRALEGRFTRTAGPEGWESSVQLYENNRFDDVLNSSTADKPAAIRAWLDEFPDESARLAFEASVRGDEEVLNHLIAAQKDLTSKKDLFLTPFHAACYNGRLGAAQILLDSGFDVNLQDEFGGTPLMRAAAGGRGEILAWLLENGADPHARETRSGKYGAAELGAKHSDVIRQLLDAGVEWSAAAMAAAASHGNAETFGLLVSKGKFAVGYPLDNKALLSAPSSLSDDQREGVSMSLQYLGASTASSTSIARWLLHHVALSRDEQGYVLDKTDRELQNKLEASLRRSIEVDSLAMVELLLPHVLANPPPPQTDPTGSPMSISDTINTLLVSAAAHDAVATARYFLATHSADPNATVGPTSITPLAVAAANSHVPMIRLLVSEFGADIHILADGRTALWTAIWNQQEAATRALLRLGGPVSGVHAEIEPGIKKIWVAASASPKMESEEEGRKTGGEGPEVGGSAAGSSGEVSSADSKNVGGEVKLLAWMDPMWIVDGEWDERSQQKEEVRFMCLERPEGYIGTLEYTK